MGKRQGNMCVKYVVNNTCPKGWVKKGNMCYKRPDAKLKCGKGMVLSKDGKKCNRKVVVTIKSKCPKGFVLKGKTCLKFITIVKNTCPKGYVKKGKMCEKTGKAVYNCPKGYVKL